MGGLTMPRSFVLACVVLCILSSVAGDVWMWLGAGGPYALIWLLTVFSGSCMVLAATHSAYACVPLLVVAGGHALALAMIVAEGESSFYGGGMVAVIGCYCWALITLTLLVIAGVRLARVSRPRSRH